MNDKNLLRLVRKLLGETTIHYSTFSENTAGGGGGGGYD